MLELFLREDFTAASLHEKFEFFVLNNIVYFNTVKTFENILNCHFCKKRKFARFIKQGECLFSWLALETATARAREDDVASNFKLDFELDLSLSLELFHVHEL